MSFRNAGLLAREGEGEGEGDEPVRFAFSLGGSGNCKDVYPQYCPGYKQNGMCTDPNYLDYVKEVCKWTCGFCSEYHLTFF